ncbi:MAG: GNAT family N-acetyltransferase [Clostridia bacterium]|nr:GNAT family N-acetyltransferase [Clostridia bacterium]
MFGKLKFSDVEMMKEYVETYEKETIYLRKPLEDFSKGLNSGIFYGYMDQKALKGMFYFSKKNALALHFSDLKVLGNLNVLKAIKLYKPKFIKGPKDQIEAIYKMLCRSVGEIKESSSILMSFEGHIQKCLPDKSYTVVDGDALTTEYSKFMENLFKDIKFFIEVEQYFGRQIKAINDILKELRAMMKQGNYVLFLHGNQIVAQGLIEDETDEIGIIGGIYVSETFRKKGLGYLISCLLTAKILDRHKKAFLFVMENNLEARQLYEKIGYTVKMQYTVLSIAY